MLNKDLCLDRLSSFHTAILITVESQTLDRVTIAKIDFPLKGHSKFTSNLSFIISLKILDKTCFFL